VLLTTHLARPWRRLRRGLPMLSAVVVLLLAAAGCVRYQPDEGTVALTFDDGPHPTWTPQVLDVLDQLQVKATFFVVGDNVRRYPGLVAEIQRRGHSVQNHSYTHADLVTLDNEAVTQEIRRTTAEIQAAGAPGPHCLRPPYGSYDQRIDLLAAAENLELLLWDVDPRDWSRPGVPTIVDRATQAGSGDIILFHDGGGDRSQTVAALPEVVNVLRERGYGFQTLCVPVG
jgi:peptidoglycan/xylan/chitin deacetylase (PgdA/CDA1 family)